MTPALRELKVPVLVFASEHDPVEAVVIFEAAKNAKPETTAVHASCTRQVAYWSSDAELMWHGVECLPLVRGLTTALSGAHANVRQWQFIPPATARTRS